MTLEDRIRAFEAQLERRDASRDELDQAERELRAALIAAVLPVLPGLCRDIRQAAPGATRKGVQGDGWVLWADGLLELSRALPTPGELAATLADLLDRQLAGSMDRTSDARQAQAALLRALAGAVAGMRDVFRRDR